MASCLLPPTLDIWTCSAPSRHHLENKLKLHSLSGRFQICNGHTQANAGCDLLLTFLCKARILQYAHLDTRMQRRLGADFGIKAILHLVVWQAARDALATLHGMPDVEEVENSAESKVWGIIE